MVKQRDLSWYHCCFVELLVGLCNIGHCVHLIVHNRVSAALAGHREVTQNRRPRHQRPEVPDLSLLASLQIRDPGLYFPDVLVVP